MARWQANGWLTSDKKPVKNRDLWERLPAALADHNVRWHWVNGHAGHVENERVDQLARDAALKIKNDMGTAATNAKRWRSMRQIVLDTETTGLEVQRGHRLIEIGCVELAERRPTGRTLPRLSQSRPRDRRRRARGHRHQRRVPARQAALRRGRGASSSISSTAPRSSRTTPSSTSASSTPNSGLPARARAASPITRSVLDTLALAREKFPGQRNSLDALCRRLGIDNSHREWHGALLDAQLLAEVYLAMTAGQGLLGFGEESAEQVARISVSDMLHDHRAAARAARARRRSSPRMSRGSMRSTRRARARASGSAWRSIHARSRSKSPRSIEVTSPARGRGRAEGAGEGSSATPHRARTRITVTLSAPP